MADLALKVAGAPAANVPLIRAAGLLLFGVFALKAALLPLYLWLPGAYAGACASVAALFTIMTKVGAYSILRVYTLIFGAEAGPAAHLLEPWLLPLALATLAIGMLGAVASHGLREQAAYLVVASIGSLLIAFGLDNPAGIAAGLYYLPHTTFAAAALFLLADIVARQRGTLLADRFQVGPAIAHPGLLGALFLITAVAVAGLPPLGGFLGKWLTLRAALDHAWLPGIMSVVLGGALLGMIALARSGSLLFYQVDPEAAQAPETSLSRTLVEIAPLIGLLALVVGLTVSAGPVFEQAHAIAEQMLEPQRYIQAVLRPGGSF
jgi:multicomponent K+:H+ antiporter subunit D